MTRTWLCVLTLAAFLCRAEDAGLASPGASGATLKVLAFNVLFKGANNAKSLRAVTEEDADVVCLTELTPTFVKEFENDAVLAKKYPHRVFVPQLGTWGVGFASKLPLSAVQTFGVAPIKLPAMEATVAFAGQPLELTCVHLQPPGGKDGVTLETLAKTELIREKQAGTLTTRYAKLKSPSILLGDFNEEPGGKTMRALARAGWERGCILPDSSCTPTFPGAVVAWPAVFTIDHVLARGLDFESTNTVRGGGSDHYPVAAPKASQK
ncbi:MAG: endonuclease/exonuclease/phosphatase family protein [Archangium sp.]|nr:endonuclease/exonuclease/phosphatase family protein [Archangium sp.]